MIRIPARQVTPFLATLALLLVAQPLVSHAQSHDGWTPAQEQVWSNENALWQELLTADTAAWARWWHPGYTGWPAEAQRPTDRTGVLAARDNILRVLKTGSLKYTLDPLGVSVSDNVAVVHYTFTWTAEHTGGGMVNGSGRCSHVWLRESGKWSVLTGSTMLTSFENLGVPDTVADADADELAVQMINQLLVALKIQDDNRRQRAVVGLVHKSLLTRDGGDLDWNIKEYSYKKAYRGVHQYEYPAVIVRTTDKREQVVGFAETAERGWVQTYYIKTTDAIKGMPAPIQLFFPLSGDPPRILQLSL
jgi:ketosteroid isomerase-like protein